MSNTEYIKLKLELANKLAKYISQQPELLEKFSGYSYVIYYSSNNEFNKKNMSLIKSLKEEDKKIVKATFTNEADNWTFAPLI